MHLEFGAVLTNPVLQPSTTSDNLQQSALDNGDQGVVHVAFEVHKERTEPEAVRKRTVAVMPGGADLVSGRTLRDRRTTGAFPAFERHTVPVLRFWVYGYPALRIPLLYTGIVRFRLPAFTTPAIAFLPAKTRHPVSGPFHFIRVLVEPPVADQDAAVIQHLPIRQLVTIKERRSVYCHIPIPLARSRRTAQPNPSCKRQSAVTHFWNRPCLTNADDA